jgi:hypothetical protein
MPHISFKLSTEYTFQSLEGQGVGYFEGLSWIAAKPGSTFRRPEEQPADYRSTFPPRQKATWSLIDFAASLGSG